MVKVIAAPKSMTAAGEPPKTIQEFIGRLNTGTGDISIARMVSPAGWSEPGQTPEFDEYTIVLRGALQVETREQSALISPGQAVIARAGEWVRYSTPEAAEYIAICLPAFSPAMVHRDG